MSTRPKLGDEINKRLTLNLLIQGSAQHAFITAHHLVRDELNAIEPELVPLYDKLALAGVLQYWSGLLVTITGHPARFWQRAIFDRGHPFYGHRLLARHGRTLVRAAKARAEERCRSKGVFRVPVMFSFQVSLVARRILKLEDAHKPALVELARKMTAQVWGIDIDRLDAELTKEVEFVKLPVPKGMRQIFLRAAAAGYSGVVRRDEELRVVARAWVWPLLLHELVKGTMELICLHGLNELSDLKYRLVMAATDRIEYESWQLAAGAELWRRMLPLLPDAPPVAEMMMHIARLPAHSLEALMLAVIEKPQWARELLAALG